MLSWVQGVRHGPDELHRIFYAARSLRHVDQLGYVRFRHWRIYGAGGLAKQRAAIWLHSETLTIEFAEEPLAQYAVSYESGWQQLRTVEPRRLFETKYCSPQHALWEPREGEWLQVLRVPQAAPRRRRVAGHQSALFEL